MNIQSITAPSFRKYGKVITNIDFSTLVDAMKSTPVPSDVVYEPKIAELMALPVAQEISDIFYGEMPIQIGYCNGHNNKLNAVEYHRSSEINVAATDAVLLLGMQADVEDDFTYDTAKMEAFLLPAGTAVELYATTLHYAPCHANAAGFQVAIILPDGTNYPLTKEHVNGEDKLLAATNKWLIGHEEGGLSEGSFLGLKGENITL